MGTSNWIKLKDVKELAYIVIYDKIVPLSNMNRKEHIMATEKKLTDVKEFVESINKKNKEHNGKAIQFAFVNKQRKSSKKGNG